MEGTVHLIPKATVYWFVLKYFVLADQAKYRNLIWLWANISFKNKFQMLLMVKVQYFKPILFPEGTFRFLTLTFWFQQNKISVFCLVGKDKMWIYLLALETKWTVPFKFDYFRQINRKCNLNLKFTPCLFFWRHIFSAIMEVFKHFSIDIGMDVY